MSVRLRSTPLALVGAMAIILAVSGAVLGADQAEGSGGPDTAVTAPVAADGTTTAFVDADGNGVADSCQDVVIADPVAAAAADAAVDTNGDGTIGVPEAAHSDRVGGANCNHGGYVSGIAGAQCDGASTGDAADQNDEVENDAEGADPAEENEQGDEDDQGEDGESGTPATLTTALVTPPGDETTSDASAADCDTTVPTDESAPTTPCVEVPAPPFDPAADTSPGAFGRYVASVAASDAVGGKNCNHGGAVSEAVHAAKALAKAAQGAAKAERAAARDAAKALRALGRAGKSHGHGHGH